MDGQSVQPRPRVAVFGDGIEGLACAHYLRRAGIAISLIAAPEPSRELAARFVHGGRALERFHAPIRPSDTALLGLTHDLGVAHRLIWRRGAARFHSVPTATCASPSQRLRAALAMGWIARYGRYARDLERVGARSWLCAHVGERVFEQILEPLLRARLGELDDEVSAAAAWRALADLAGRGERSVGYLRGGLSGLLDALRGALGGDEGVERIPEGAVSSWLVRPGGVELRRGSEAQTFAARVSTVPPREGSGWPAGIGDAEDEGARWDTLVSVALVGQAELPLPYRSLCVDPLSAAGTLYRSDLLIPREDTHGCRVHYFTRRARAGQPVEPREVLEKQAREYLRVLVAGSTGEIEAAAVSTARVPSPRRQARAARSGGATVRGPLFVSRADAHASGEGSELEACVLAARSTAERVRSYLLQRG